MAISDDERLSYAVGSVRFGARRDEDNRTYWRVYCVAFYPRLVHLVGISLLVVDDYGYLVTPPQ